MTGWLRTRREAKTYRAFAKYFDRKFPGSRENPWIERKLREAAAQSVAKKRKAGGR